MSRQIWFAGSSRFFVLMTVLAYAVAVTGCGQTAPPPADTPAEHDDHDHDHDGHDHDHDHEGHDHDGHDHDSADIDVDSLMPIDAPAAPASLADGVEQLVSLRDVIAKGFEEDDVDAIHDQLHSIGGLLEYLESKVSSSELPTETKDKAASAIDTLFDAFGDVDAKLHGDLGKDYSDVSSKIDTAVKTLSELDLSKS